MEKITQQPPFFKQVCCTAMLVLGTLAVISCSPNTQPVREGNTATAKQLPAPSTELTRVETLTDSMAALFIRAAEVPGMTVAIAKDGKVFFSKAYGKADIEMDVAAAPETVYNIASLTKQFTAATIMRLVEEGKLSLDDPITKYLPDYPTQGHHVTVHHLLSHTSGIRDYKFKNDSLPGWYRLELSYQQMIDLWGNEPFDFKPGEAYDYNNMGYYLLGQIIERVTGTPWAEYVEPKLLQPLGLQHAYFNDARKVIPNRAKGYIHDKEQPTNVPARSMHLFSAGGGLAATAGDLIRWTHLLHNGQVISPESVRLMSTPTVLSNGDTVGYGYGLYVSELGGHRKIYHGGTFGFGTYLSHYPEEGLTIAILANSTKGRDRAEQLEKALAREILDVKVYDLPLSPEEMSRYEGTYTYQSTPTLVKDLRIFREDGQLKAQFGKGRGIRLLSQGSHQFLLETNDEMRIAFVVENGRAESLDIHEGRWEVTPARRKL